MPVIARAIDGREMELYGVMAASRFLWAAQPHGSPHSRLLQDFASVWEGAAITAICTADSAALKLRTDCDYRRLALQSQAWKTMPSKKKRTA